MKPILFRTSIIVFNLFIAVQYSAQSISLNQFSQKEILAAEEVFHHFKEDFDLNNKILTVSPQNTYSALDQKLFVNYIRSILFETNPLIEVIQEKQKEADLKKIYSKKLTELFNDNATYINFNQYKNDFLSNQSGTVNTGTRAAGQPCVNIDFEDGTTSGWDGTFGNTCNAGNRCYNQTGTGFNGNHTVMNAAGFDPTIGALSVQSPFAGTNTVRLGDLAAGNGAATIAHTFLVTAAKPVFTYSFAVAMEDPGHNQTQQPFFAIDFFDQLGNPINNCGTYYVSAGAGNPGFQNQGGWQWKDWASIYLDVSGYVGQNITILFTISDCDQGGHQGRAYIDAECLNPQITFAPNCNGRTLVAPPGLWQYAWKDQLGTVIGTNQTLNVTTTGLYSVDLISESGCVVTIDTIVNFIPVLLGINTTKQDVSCNGLNDGSITINASNGTPPYQYSNDNGVTYVANNTFNNLAPGTYNLSVMDAQGCSQTATVTINEPNPIVIDETHTDAKCNGSCDGTIALTVTGGTAAGGYDYKWDNNPFCPCASKSNLCAGNHTIIVRDDNGCTETINIVINEPTALTLTTDNDTTVCNGATINRNAQLNGGTAPYNYTWSSSGLTFNGTSITITPTNNVSFKVIGIDGNGCRDSANVDIDVLPLLNIQAFANPAVICLGESTQLFANGTGGDGAYTYTWDNGIGNVQNPVVQPTATTTYTVTFDDGCETPAVTAPVTVTVNPLPVVDFDADKYEGCTPTTINFQNLGNQANISATKWHFGNGETSNSFSPNSVTYETIGCFDVKLILTTNNGCIDSLTKTDFICNHPNPIADFEADKYVSDVWRTNFEFTNYSSLNDYNYWDIGGLANSTAIDTSYTFPEDHGAFYNICLKVETVNGCLDSICKEIEIEERSYFFVPNTFSPDDNGINEIFIPVTVGLSDDDYNFSVFDRWGVLLFTTDRKDKGWNGLDMKGKPQKQDTYIWKVEATLLESGKKIVKRGHVNLIK